MKVKILYTTTTIKSKNYSNTFSSVRHKIDYVNNPTGYIIDGTTFVPYHNVSELVIDIEELQTIPLAMEAIEATKTLPEDWPHPDAVAKSLELHKKSKKIK